LTIFDEPEFEDIAWKADAHSNLAQAMLIDGDVEDAASHAEASLNFARETGDIRIISAALYALGDVRCVQRRLVDAINAFEEADAIMDRAATARPSLHIDQALHGLASSVMLVAADDAPSLPILRNLIGQTESLCLHLGIATPDTRLGYESIRTSVLGPRSSPPIRGPMSFLPVSIEDSLAMVRLVFTMVRRSQSQQGRQDQPDTTPAQDALIEPVDPLTASGRNPPPPRTPLTPLQLETVRLLVDGLTVKEIADHHRVNEKSVYERFTRVREKWGLDPRATLAEIAVYAVRHHVV
jgi:DNA-binding CsgD family transcriptional regulator